MSQPAPTKTKKASKNKDEVTSPDADHAHDRSFDSRESVEAKEPKEAPETTNTDPKPKKKKTTKAKQSTEGEPNPSGEPGDQAKGEEAGNLGEATSPDQAEDKKKKAKKPKAKKEEADSTNVPEGTSADAEGSTKPEETKNELEQEAGDKKPKKKKKAAADQPIEESKGEPTAAVDQEEKPKKTKKKKAENKDEVPGANAEPTEQKVEEPAPVATSDKPKGKKAAAKGQEVAVDKIEIPEKTSPGAAKGKAGKDKLATEPEVAPLSAKGKDAGKAEPQKPINLKEINKQEIKTAPVKGEKPKETVSPTGGVIDLKQKGIQDERPQSKQAPNKNAKNMPEIDLNAAKANITETVTSPNKTVAKGKAPTQAVTSPTGKPAETIKSSEIPVKPKTADAKPDPKALKQGGKAAAAEPKKEEPVAKGAPESATKRSVTSPTSAGQKVIQDDKKTAATKGKGEPEQGRKLETAKTEVSDTSKLGGTRRAKSPDGSKFVEQRTRNFEENQKNNNMEKTRMRSFDAGKTEKISADDSFETRAKMWETRKKEKLLEEEKRRIREEAEQCTFNPKLNKKSLSRQLSPGGIYERNLEWTEKVKANVVAKGEKAFEETRKPDLKKNKVKSGTDSLFHDERSAKLHGGFHGPQYGVTRTGFVPPTNTSPLEVKHSLADKITEINDIYDLVSSSIKAKSTKALGKPAVEQPKKVKQAAGEEKQAENAETYKYKTGGAKIVPVNNQEEVDRIAALKGILNLKSAEKKPQSKAKQQSGERHQEPEGPEVFVSDIHNAEEVLKKNTKHLEIRNNRYVMVDNNISAIEKKEGESPDNSMNQDAEEIEQIL